ncbi:ABC-2 transporter permease [Staphylococcus pettenkoferi]|uniref:ABC-2 transporter permease n=1 Tax=Staphylococcus pettenkoferi TaxID=170573 RepID=UPI00066E8C8D|nr:ABC-2 transporter permease [Staphylococcus pettenkoferi]MCY1627114.1 ABC-2 transporter permease [Staphylococcus pettenkoferi]PNZ89221.1 ABC-2 transporter permease [Staphylococcus pettenkoferi]QQC38412.1 ABC-2 transporter permease [Staphylococcus pettenkoferi]UIK46891.1 ABC-2 transporter permease [Staphylococcus pettenkoferi]
MKGVFLTNFYATKKQFIMYLIIGIIMSLVFSFINPMMGCFMPMVLLLNPASDNIKHEKESHWMYYVSTLPNGRKGYVNSYFIFVLIAVVIGLIIGMIAILILQQSLTLALLAILFGLGSVGIYSLIFPFTFKFGPENSNSILMTVTFVLLIAFFAIYFLTIQPAFMKAGSFTGVVHDTTALTSVIGFGIFGIIMLFISYFSSLSIFKNQEL